MSAQPTLMPLETESALRAAVWIAWATTAPPTLIRMETDSARPKATAPLGAKLRLPQVTLSEEPSVDQARPPILGARLRPPQETHMAEPLKPLPIGDGKRIIGTQVMLKKNNSNKKALLVFGSAGTRFLAGLFGLLEDSCIFAGEIYESLSYEEDHTIGIDRICILFLC